MPRTLTLWFLVALLCGATIAWPQQDEDDAPQGKEGKGQAFKGKGGGKGGRGAVDESAEKAKALPKLQVMQLVRPGVYMVSHKGANTLFRPTEEGVIVVNTKLPGEDNFERLMHYIEGVTSQPVKAVFNTGSGPEHAGNNELFEARGARIITGETSLKMGDVEVRSIALGQGFAVYFPADRVIAVNDLATASEIDQVLKLDWDRAVLSTGQPMTRSTLTASRAGFR